MPTKIHYRVAAGGELREVSGSCTSASTTSTVGRRIRCLARSRGRGHDDEVLVFDEWRTRCRPTKPLPPMTRSGS